MATKPYTLILSNPTDTVNLIAGDDRETLTAAMEQASNHIVLDCADTVAQSNKKIARKEVVHSLRSKNWTHFGKLVSVRINPPSSSHMYRDIVDIVEQAGRFLDSIHLPCVTSVKDIYAVDCLLAQIEAAVNIDNPIALEIYVDTACDPSKIDEIAGASPRVRRVHISGIDEIDEASDIPQKQRLTAAILKGDQATINSLLQQPGTDSEDDVRHYPNTARKQLITPEPAFST